MQVFVNDLLVKLSDIGHEPRKYKIKKIKMINDLLHAVIVDVEDEKSELVVALSVLNDKNKYKIIKKKIG